MNNMTTGINLSQHDDLYQILVDMHEGKTDEESRKINAKLIITMMNQIGDPLILMEIFDLVRSSTDKHQ